MYKIGKVYIPGQVNYSKRCFIEFIFPYYYELGEGNYPQEDTGYTDTEYSHSPTHKAYYDDAIVIYAEVSKRLELIGQQSKLLLYCYNEQMDEFDIAKQQGIPVEVLLKKLRSMMRYITGYRRPEVDYGTWKKNGHIKYPTIEKIDRILANLIFERV